MGWVCPLGVWEGEDKVLEMKECRTCSNWQMRGNPEMANVGFARCALGEKWRFWPPSHTCGKFEMADPRAIEKRNKVLKGIGA